MSLEPLRTHFAPHLNIMPPCFYRLAKFLDLLAVAELRSAAGPRIHWAPQRGREQAEVIIETCDARRQQPLSVTGTPLQSRYLFDLRDARQRFLTSAGCRRLYWQQHTVADTSPHDYAPIAQPGIDPLIMNLRRHVTQIQAILACRHATTS
jgi:hypothetical protein